MPIEFIPEKKPRAAGIQFIPEKKTIPSDRAPAVGSPTVLPGKPGSSPENPLQESGLTANERGLFKFYEQATPEERLAWLRAPPGMSLPAGSKTPFEKVTGIIGPVPFQKTRQYDAEINSRGEFAVRPKGSGEPWRVIDPAPSLGRLNPFGAEFWRDVTDITPEILSAMLTRKVPTSPQGYAAQGAGMSAFDAALPRLAQRTMGSGGIIQEGGGPTIGRDVGAVGARGATGAVVGGAFGLLGKAYRGASEALGRTAGRAAEPNPLKWPYLVEEQIRRGTKSRLERISGRAAQEAAQEAEVQAARAAKQTEREQLIKKLFEEDAAERAAREAARAAGKMRSTEEAATLQGQTVQAAEFGKEASRIRADIKEHGRAIRELRRQAAETEDDAAKAAIRDQIVNRQRTIDQLAREADAMSEKGLETRSRAGLYRLSQKQRAAKEAETGVPAGKAPTPEPSPAAPFVSRAIPMAAKTAERAAEGVAEPGLLGKAFRGTGDIFKEQGELGASAAKRVHEISQEAAQQASRARQLAAKKVITWRESDEIVQNIWGKRHGAASQAWADYFERAVQLGREAGESLEQSVQSAIRKTELARLQEVRREFGTTPIEIPNAIQEAMKVKPEEPVEEVIERAVKSAGEKAQKASLRTFIDIAPGIAWRVSGGALTRGMAIASDLIENPPKWMLVYNRAPPRVRQILAPVTSLLQAGKTEDARRVLSNLIQIEGVRSYLESGATGEERNIHRSPQTASERR